MTSKSSRVGSTARSDGLELRARLFAANAHLVVSAVVASAVLAIVCLCWYPAPLDSISGVGDILVMLLAIDVTVGPLLTLFVYDRRKNTLRFDLGCIGLMQVAALVYGVYTVEAGRPHHLVFVKDRFEVVSRADLQANDRTAAIGNSAARIDWFGPRVVAAEMPSSDEERRNLLFESVLGGRDVQHFPKQYRNYATQAALAAGKAKPLSDLRDINPGQTDILQTAIERSGMPESSLKFLPVKGPQGDATMLIDASSGEIAGMVDLQPWR